MPPHAPLPRTPMVAGALALEPLETAPGVVHVWSWGADGSDDDAVLLDAAETERAARFRFERDRARFVAHHAFTRRVLGRYLGVEPAAVVVRTGDNGKPELGPDAGTAFNTSRSGGLSLVAVSGAPVGVDVERLRHMDDALPLATSLFAPQERALLASIPPDGRDEAFLAIWTRKEAVVKAFGLGLSVALDAFDVCGAEGLGTGLWQGRLGSEPFTVTTLDVRPGWIAAVAVTGSRLEVRHLGSAASGDSAVQEAAGR